jgi:hypothetical protein
LLLGKNARRDRSQSSVVRNRQDARAGSPPRRFAIRSDFDANHKELVLKRIEKNRRRAPGF